MFADYRRVLAVNVRALLDHHQTTTTALAKRAAYLDGPKRGRLVSERTVRYFLEGDGPGAGLDALAALAAVYDLMPWQLLVPGFDPANPPYIALSDAEKRLHAEFQRLRRQIAAGGVD